MTTFLVRDTADGYEIALQRGDSAEMVIATEGGHDIVESAYAHVATCWDTLRKLGHEPSFRSK